MATKLRLSSGDPKPKVTTGIGGGSSGRGVLDEQADVRDLISSLVGKGYTTLMDDNSRAAYNRLQILLGRPRAQKLMEQVFIYNQNPEHQRRPVEDKINTFYNLGSRDAQTNDLLKKTKSLGYGVLPAFRESNFVPNIMLQGKAAETGTTASAPLSDEIKQKVLLKFNR